MVFFCCRDQYRRVMDVVRLVNLEQSRAQTTSVSVNPSSGCIMSSAASSSRSSARRPPGSSMAAPEIPYVILVRSIDQSIDWLVDYRLIFFEVCINQSIDQSIDTLGMLFQYHHPGSFNFFLRQRHQSIFNHFCFFLIYEGMFSLHIIAIRPSLFQRLVVFGQLFRQRRWTPCVRREFTPQLHPPRRRHLWSHFSRQFIVLRQSECHAGQRHVPGRGQRHLRPSPTGLHRFIDQATAGEAVWRFQNFAYLERSGDLTYDRVFGRAAGYSHPGPKCSGRSDRLGGGGGAEGEPWLGVIVVGWASWQRFSPDYFF